MDARDSPPASASRPARSSAAAPLFSALALALGAGALGFALGSRQGGGAAGAAAPVGAPEGGPDAAALAAALPLTAEGALVALEERYVLQALPGARLALYRFEPRIDALRLAPSLALERIFALRHDPLRHITEPEARSGHGYYLDDVAKEAFDALARDLAEFGAIAAERTTDAERLARLDRLAERILEGGDARSLLNALALESYAARRGAALALGEAGFVAAAPALIEVMAERSERGERAKRALERLAGRPLAGREEAQAWWNALPAVERFRRPGG